MLKNLLLLSSFLISQITFAQYKVTTYSGSGIAGHLDGSSATARFDRPVGIASDKMGNIYVCDFNKHCIRKIDTAGIVSTIAGSPGLSGFSNGIGSSARFNQPGGICLDSVGNIYVTDNGNHRIRKIDTSFNVTSIAGNGVSGFINGIGANARLNTPRDLCIDASNDFIYFVDRNRVVRRIKLSNSNVTTYAGSGVSGYIDSTATESRFKFTAGVAIDQKGNVYVADRDNHAIRKIDTSGKVSTFCGNGLSGSSDGQGLSARFNGPLNLSFDSYGNLYVADFNNDLVRKIDTNANVSTLAGDGTNGFLNGSADTAKFREIFGIEVVDSNTIFVTDASNRRIRLIEQKICKSIFDTLNISSCSSYSSPSGNYSWTQSGTYYDTINIRVNCDSLFTINLIIDTNTTVFRYDTACGSYLSPSGKTFATSGLYYDTIANHRGCDSLMTIFLTLDTASSSTINVTECNSYISPSNKFYNRTGTYLDTVLNNQGCDSIITINLIIDTITSGVTQNGNILIANQNNVQYQWLDCSNNYSTLQNDTNQSFSSFYSGSYAVEVANSCVDTSNCFSLVIVGIENRSNQDNFKISPNPTNGNLFIESAKKIELINIYSSKGKLVEQFVNPSSELDISHLSKGMYFIQLVGENFNTTNKIILK